MNCQYCGFPLDEKKLCEHCSNLLTYSFDDLKFIIGDGSANNQPDIISTSAIDKGIHTLEGLLFALQLDGNINSIIMDDLKSWAEEYKDYIDIQPFYEAINIIKNPPENSFEAMQIFNDILWVCNNLGFANKYYEMITADLQVLSTLLSDCSEETPFNSEQFQNLKSWQKTIEHFSTIYPYCEITKIFHDALLANLFLNSEYNKLKSIINQFHQNNKDFSPINLQEFKNICKLENILTETSNIDLFEKNICLTGRFANIDKKELIKKLRTKKIYTLSNVSPKTSYLIVGNTKSSCWPFYSYGRKIEDVLTLKEQKYNIKIITEDQLLHAINKMDD